MPSRTDRDAGFMLVEVLAALVVTVALVVVVLPFMGDLVRRWQEGQASIVRADGWMRAVARLTDDVAEALPLRDPSAGPSLAFSMTPTRVELIRPALGAAAPAGFEQVAYRVERGESGERLVRTTRPVLDGRGGGPGSSSVTMIEGPYTFRFAATGKDGVRTSQWPGGEALPLRLDLAVASATGSGRVPFGPIALPIVARADMATVTPLLRTIRPPPAPAFAPD